MPALFIGRFQPFHLGHLNVIKTALEENDHLYIGIGSTQYSFEPENPFTTGERIEMIQKTLQVEKLPAEKYSIIPIPNIENYALWPKHVSNYLPPFQKIYTGSPIVKNLFENYNQELKTPYLIEFIEKKLTISATEIRNLIKTSGDWQKLVPPTVANFLSEHQAEKRLNHLN